jgi:GTP-binding protein YchF
MRLGIIGLPSAGKTTIFNALTGASLPTGVMAGGGRVEVHTAVVDVPDERLEALSGCFRPRKTTHAKVTYADIGGLQAGAGREGLPGTLVNQLTTMDGFVHVLRAFEDSNVPHPAGSVDPARDLGAMEAEFLLTDMLTVERRQAKLAEERQKGGRERAVVEREMALFQHLAEYLGRDEPLRGVELSHEESVLLAGFGLLSRRPMLAVVNVAEGQAPPELGELGPGVMALCLQGKLEMEIAQLTPEEAKLFLQEYGIPQAGRDRVVRASYDLLGLNTFFTLNEDEARAWALPRGGTALQAADTVHSDLARGFIRAEVMRWDELIAAGGHAAARASGKLRQEGKDYPVQDGEVVQVKFNV